MVCRHHRKLSALIPAERNQPTVKHAGFALAFVSSGGLAQLANIHGNEVGLVGSWVAENCASLHVGMKPPDGLFAHRVKDNVTRPQETDPVSVDAIDHCVSADGEEFRKAAGKLRSKVPQPGSLRSRWRKAGGLTEIAFDLNAKSRRSLVHEILDECRQEFVETPDLNPTV